MSILRKLLSLWLVGRTVSSTSTIVTRLIISMAGLLILAIFAALFAVALIIGILWLLYEAVLLQGIIPETALAIVGGIFLITLTGLIVYVRSIMHNIWFESRSALSSPPSQTDHMSKVVTSFITGFLSRKL